MDNQRCTVGAGERICQLKGESQCTISLEFRKDLPKKWGGANDKFFEATQTAFTVSAISLAAWLLWDDMEDETKLLVQNVLSWYAFRWSGEDPRDGTYVDTQLEENSWTARGIASAADLFPEHPLSDKWRNEFQRWTINSLTVSNDRMAQPSGFPQIITSTMHSDYTSENHGFVHPTYMILGIMQRSAHMLFALASGEKPDACALFNNENLYHKTIRSLIQRDGLAIPLQGQDWWYNRQHEIFAIRNKSEPERLAYAMKATPNWAQNPKAFAPYLCRMGLKRFTVCTAGLPMKLTGSARSLLLIWIIKSDTCCFIRREYR